MFELTDTEKTGLLTYAQFKDSFKSLTYNLTEHDVKMMIALADEDENELIPWKNFVPIGIDLVRTIYRRNLAGTYEDVPH